MSIFRSSATAALPAIAVGVSLGCSLAPRYVRPVVPIPAAYKEVPSRAGIWEPARPADAFARGEWWKVFKDPELDALEGRLDSSNQNIAGAAAAFLAARALVRESRSQYFPSLAVSPGATRERISATPLGVAANTSFTEYTLPADASWMPDFWGKTRSAVAANTFAAQASAADLQSVRLSAHAELAADYYHLRAQDALCKLLASAAAADREALRLNRTLYRAGLISDQAVAASAAQFQTDSARAADARVLRAQYEHAIAVLLGVAPLTFTIAMRPFVAPGFPAPSGVPSQLLERRPDIAAAERAVAEANARIGAARAAYFPSLTLTAAGGYQSFVAGSWLEWATRFWSLGAAAGETVFDAGLRNAVVREAKASYDQAAARYRQAVLSAFQQVEDDLVAVRISSENVQRQAAAVESGRRNLSEATVRYRVGLDPYLIVLAARNSLVACEQIQLNYQIQRVTAGIQLIEALGGGWDQSQLSGIGTLP